MISHNKLLRIAFSISFLFLTILLNGQSIEPDATMHQIVQQRTDEIFDSLVKVRRDLHAYPELSEQEKRTSEQIAKYLTALGLEVKTNVGGHGVVGILETHKKGKRIAWRADIDALASEVPDSVSFSSKNEGVRHICGHDVHTTIALGIADVLTSMKDRLTGTVYFIFQPSEENIKGAKAMIEDGLFDIIDPEEIYALHITPMPSGMISTRANWPFAGYRTATVSFKNTSENDSIISFTKKLLLSFQNIKPDSKFWDTRNLLDPNIGLANPNTIFKDFLTVSQNIKISKTDTALSISTNISVSSQQKLDSMISMLKEKISTSKFSKKLIDVSLPGDYPVVSNDKELTTNTMNSLSTIYGKERVVPTYGAVPDGRGDDFAYFQHQIPGVYFLLGGSNFEKGIISMPHAPNFEVDENSIKTGVNFFSSMILERLQNQ
ncbi:amidohydrolase [uncultured Maribacter sp.]|uniref:M20 metallopeptidase family protein n=1 Tax=uncultured Maribacter sp. TaxID=431308 RepID=UPI0030EB4C85|tara:strand:- start:16647 stop:17951 length:1305 start_codon:yes stop_codon:yes gene_type:complete